MTIRHNADRGLVTATIDDPRRAKANQVSIPYLDPSVQHVGISRLRALNVTRLRDLDKTLVIQDNDKPLAVLLKYEHFLAMQERIKDEE